MIEPLFLNSPMHEKIWGGSRLHTKFGYTIPSKNTGEYWAISAHPNGVSTISNGVFKGQKFDELYSNHKELFGDCQSDVFPLLTKILDANDWLSIQVHPDDQYALENEGELGKTECWYVLYAEENAEIIYGHNARTKEELQQLIQDKSWTKLLRRVNVKTGDFFFVPSGTMHAIGPGIMILETQQSSDTTYRVYDFDRLDNEGNHRDLHIKQSLDVLTIGEPKNSHPDTININGLEHELLVSTDFFTVYRWKLCGEILFNKFAPYLLVSVIDGKGKISVSDMQYNLVKGQHFIIPNTVNNWSIEGDIEMIVSHI
ncbi:mannose-6-phosphate isomerase, class I [Streptococcus suis]|nr:mannose-6-phosphate isomerase, class I [Streptococcus suis]